MAHNDEGEGSEFDKGFYGEQFTELEKLGVTTVRDQLRLGALPSQLREAAIVWLARKEAKASRRADLEYKLKLTGTIVAIVAGIAGVIALFMRTR